MDEIVTILKNVSSEKLVIMFTNTSKFAYKNHRNGRWCIIISGTNTYKANVVKVISRKIM